MKAILDNGEICKRLTKDGIQSLSYPSRDGCSLAQGNACKPYGSHHRLQKHPRPGSASALPAISDESTGLSTLEFRLRGKSTRQSHGTPIFYVDIAVRCGQCMKDVFFAAKRLVETRQASGFGAPWIKRPDRALTMGLLKTAMMTPNPSSRSSSSPLKINTTA